MNVPGLFNFVFKSLNFQKILFFREQILELTNKYGEELFKHFNYLHSLIVTIGKHGIVYIGPKDNLDCCIMTKNNLISYSKVLIFVSFLI